MLVKVYDEEFEVDQKTGKGFGQVLLKIDGLINKITASNLVSSNMEFEDLKQEITIIAIDGIKKYDPNKQRVDMISKYRHIVGVKLSTFLHVHIVNKTISFIRSIHTHGNSASALSIKEQQGDSQHFFAKESASLDVDIPNLGESVGEGVRLIDAVPESGSLFNSRRDSEHIEFRLSLGSLLHRYRHRIKPDTLKCIEDIYFNDMTVRDSVKLPGGGRTISDTTMGNRLKALAPLLKELTLKNLPESIPSKSKFHKVFYQP